jgi:hypothetical protein
VLAIGQKDTVRAGAAVLAAVASCVSAGVVAASRRRAAGRAVMERAAATAHTQAGQSCAAAVGECGGWMPPRRHGPAWMRCIQRCLVRRRNGWTRPISTCLA